MSLLRVGPLTFWRNEEGAEKGFQSEWTEFSTTRAFASAITDDGREDPLSLPFDWWGFNIASKMLETLARVERLSAEGELWSNALEVYRAAMGNVLWAEYREDSSGTVLSLAGLDATVNPDAHATGEPLIRPRYGPFVTALESGASVVLLTGTPGVESDARRFFQERPVKWIPYSDDEPRPRLKIVVEKARRGIGRTIEGEPARFSEDVEKLLRGIVEHLKGRAHIVTRSKREHEASATLDIPEFQRHYYRNRESLGVAWRVEGADETAWEDGFPIVMTGPPFLPPTLRGSLSGLVHNADGETYTIPASRALQREKMAKEFFQTAARGARIHGRVLMGRVILLPGADALATLREYGERWGIEVEWVEVPPTGTMEERAERLVRAVDGMPLLPHSGLRLLLEWGDAPLSLKEVHARWRGNRQTWRAAIDALCAAGYAEPAHKEGKEQFSRLRKR